MSTAQENIIDIRDGFSITDRKILAAMVGMLPAYGHYRRSSTVTRLIGEQYGIDSEECYDIIIDLAHVKNHMSLVQGHGNFSFYPTAPDYSECRSSTFLQYLYERHFLTDVNVPVDMPLPYILLGGTPGYYRLDTKIPTHELEPVMRAVFSLIENPNLTNEELAHIIKGPKLYVGGVIINNDDLPEIYEKGYGEIRYSISRKTLNSECWGSIKEECEEFCGWYDHKLKKPVGAKKGYYEIAIKYNALLTNGTETRLFSLKEILQWYITSYKNHILKHYGYSPNEEMLHDLLLSEV